MLNMNMNKVALFATATASLLSSAHAHLAPFHKGMYCLNGNATATDYNSYAIVSPLYQLPFSGWWMHGFDDCNQYPPAAGDFLDLPAGGSFKVEIASNRAKTTLSYDGQYTSAWPDGNTYPEDYNVPDCITSPNMHTQNQSQAAGTAFAISYQSDLNNVTPENLVVFTVRYNTPWKREILYDVPAALPECPAGGCTCAWGWVPNGCGQQNIYQTPFRCRVTSSSSFASARALASPKPPVWCEDNQGECVGGAKQMIYWNQNEQNNVAVSGWDLRGEPKSPGYNAKMGWKDGAQNDIFASGGSASTSAKTSPAVQTSAAAATANAGNVRASNGSGSASTSAGNNNASANTTHVSASPTTSTATPSNTADSSTPASSEGVSVTPTNRERNRGSCSAGRRPRAVERSANTDVGSRSDPVGEGAQAHRRRHLRRGF